MPLCRKCGQDNPDVARFCLACGAPLGAVEQGGEERKLVTALFCDIVGSTATAEQLDPEDVRARLAPYYARVRAELEQFGGTVEKFIGDAVVALFGAPVAHEDDADRAVRAAFAVRDAIAELNAADEWLDLKIRVGINTGEALVVLGARAVEGEGMASGDVMNTAARLQGAAPVNGIVVGELTYRSTRDAIDYRDAEAVAAKGKSERLRIWEAVAPRETTVEVAPTYALVGRRAQLTELRQLAAKSRSGTRIVALVVGAPGIGKSRLVRELTTELEHDATVLFGRCLSYGEGITYWPVSDIVKSAAGILQSDDAAIGAEKLGRLLETLPTSDPDELRTIAAALSNLVGVATTPRGTYASEQISRAELHWGIRRLFERLAEERPLVLVVEDVHWAETTLLDLLRFVTEATPAQPIFVLGSARPELRTMEHPLVKSMNTSVIELDSLGEDESRALLAELTPVQELPPQLLEAVLRNAEGNPLFLEEMVAMILDEGADRQLESLRVPENVQSLIGSRLDLLAPPQKRTAQVASVVGQVFWRGAVETLVNGNASVDGALEELQRRDFIRARAPSSIAGEREYGFKHILIRDVAYAQLTKGRRAELHVRFAGWTSALPGGDDEFVEIVAYHLENACRLAGEIARSPVPPPVIEAVDALERAADKVVRREGWREAVRFYERALAVLGDRNPERTLTLRLSRARAQAGLGNIREAFAELTAVADATRELAGAEVRASALITLGNIDHRQGRPGDARRRLVEAQALTEVGGDAALKVRAAFGLAAVLGDYEAESEQAVAALREAITLAEDAGELALRIEGHLRLGFHLFNAGRIGESEQELRRCTELAADLGSLRDQARAAFLLGLVQFYVGSVEDAEALNRQARDWLERTSEPYFQMQNFRALALYALTKNDLADAEHWLRQAIPVGIEEGGRYMIEVYRFLAETFVRQGRLGDADVLVKFAARSVPGEDLVAKAYVQLARGAVTAARHDPAAVRMYERGIATLAEHELPIESADARIAYATALELLDEVGLAREQLALAGEAFEQMGAAGACERIGLELERLASGTGRAGSARMR